MLDILKTVAIAVAVLGGLGLLSGLILAVSSHFFAAPQDRIVSIDEPPASEQSPEH